MKKLVLLVVTLPACLLSADFWQTKSFTEWSEKEVQRILDNSPWSKEFDLAVDAPGGGSGNSKRSRGSSMGELGDSASKGGLGGANDPADVDSRLARQVPLIVRWQSSLAVKQAMVRMKYGSEAATSAEGRKLLETEEKDYVIAVAGLTPSLLRGNTDSLKQSLMEQSSLAAKGKGSIKATDVEFGREHSGVDVFFVFPRTTVFSMDDKEVDFAAKFPTFQVKQRFRLRDMALNGKLVL